MAENQKKPTVDEYIRNSIALIKKVKQLMPDSEFSIEERLLVYEKLISPFYYCLHDAEFSSENEKGPEKPETVPKTETISKLDKEKIQSLLKEFPELAVSNDEIRLTENVGSTRFYQIKTKLESLGYKYAKNKTFKLGGLGK